MSQFEFFVGLVLSLFLSPLRSRFVLEKMPSVDSFKAPGAVKVRYFFALLLILKISLDLSDLLLRTKKGSRHTKTVFCSKKKTSKQK
jgi:hypothetical protein